MVKSNKFDYSNRSNSGEKLGSIIGRDLEREVDKAIKDAGKQASKVRKASVGSNISISDTSSADLMDCKKLHVLDIKAPGKRLGDGGACTMATGLQNALNKANLASGVLLEDLNLSGNGITTRTLAHLSPAIVLARYTLKTLNLADNAIKVETDEEAIQWEEFLRSFQQCFTLRRLDLSNNDKLGPRGLEILARVHIKEPFIEAAPARGDVSVLSLADHLGEPDDDDQNTPTASEFDHMTTAQTIKRRCGLRSIPYITLTNTGLTDSGALWLSYVLEDHHYPTQLINGLNATAADTMISTYQQGSASGGIEWDEREGNLGKDGLFLLRKTEQIRRSTLLEDESISGYSVITTGEGNEDSEPMTRRSIDQGQPRARQADRRASMRSIRTTDGAENELSELDSLRKRLQRHVIAQDGASGVELWRAGLHIVHVSTVLLGLGPSERALYNGPNLFHFSAERGEGSSPRAPVQDSIEAAFSNGPIRQGTYAHTLTLNTSAASGEPELAVTEVTNSPVTPKMVFKPHRKDAFSDGSDMQMVTQKLEEQTLAGTIEQDDSPARFVHSQKARIEARGGDKAFRNTSVPSHFPEQVMRRIVQHAVPSREQGLLSEKQFEAAFLWGQDRANFNVRESWRKMADSAQVWSLLESIGGLVYQHE